MGIPFLNALMGYGRGGYDCFPPYGGYYSSYAPSYGGGYAGVFGFRSDPFIPNPYALRDYYGGMAYNSYGLSGLDSKMYRLGDCYNYKFNMMNMQLYPQNYRAYNFGGNTHFVYNPEAGSYNYSRPYNDMNMSFQYYAASVQSGTKCHVNLFTRDVNQYEALLKRFSDYAEKIKCDDKERSEEIKAKVKEMQEKLDKLKDDMDAALALGKPYDKEVLLATDRVLKELRYEFGTDCGQYKGDIDELMEEIENNAKKAKDDKDSDKTDNDDDGKTTDKKDKDSKVSKDNFPEVSISKSKKSGEVDTETYTKGPNDETKVTEFLNKDGDVVRIVEVTKNGNNVVSEVEKDADGNEVKRIEYKKGKLDRSVEYADDKKIEIDYDAGKVKTITETDVNSGNVITEITVTKKGYEKKIFGENGSRSEIEFNKDGYPKKKTVYNGDSVEYIEEIHYSGGKKSGSVKYEADGKTVISKISYSYKNDENEPASAKEYDNEGNQIAKYKFKYNDDGLVSEETKTNNDGSYVITEYEYDAHGRVSNKTVTKYDKDDNEIS